nr:NAD(P)-dependent oxidoreductase [uncultured Mucilaginibacter sp.]
MKERVLITGASGFVGYHLIEEALKNNFEVYAAIRKSSGVSHLKKFNIQYTHLKFNDVASLTQEIQEKRYDYIIHAAGVVAARSQKEFRVVNVEFTQNLARAAGESGVKKIVFISSLAALGPLKTLNGTITETTHATPITAYGKSKLLAEQKVAAQLALNYTILRPTAVYGPRDGRLFIFIKQIAKGLEPYVGNIEQKLSFVYAKDLASVCVKALYAPHRTAYNISDGNFYGRFELADAAKEILKVRTFKFHLPVKFAKIVAAMKGKISSLRGKPPVINLDKIAELTATNWNCSIEHAKADLGFYPSYNLHAGIAETLAWYKENKWL